MPRRLIQRLFAEAFHSFMGRFEAIMSPTSNSLTVKRKLFSYPYALSIMQRNHF